MYFTNLELFSVSKTSLFQKLRYVGESKHHYFDHKTGLFAMFFTEKRYKSTKTGSISSNTNNIIPLGICRHPSIPILLRPYFAPPHYKDKNLKAVFFSSGRLLHTPSSVLPICLRIARARPTKILKATTLPKFSLDFNPNKSVSNSIFN